MSAMPPPPIPAMIMRTRYKAVLELSPVLTGDAFSVSPFGESVTGVEGIVGFDGVGVTVGFCGVGVGVSGVGVGSGVLTVTV